MSELGCYTTSTGQRIGLRFVEENDVGLLVELFQRLSPESQRLRFQLYTAKLPEERLWQEAARLCRYDPQRQVAIVALFTEGDGREHAVGVARFIRATIGDTEAEVAVVVRDDFQRRGLGKHLLLTLAEKARNLGLTHFTAWVLDENVRLMKLIKDMELKNVESHTRHGQRKIRVPL